MFGRMIGLLFCIGATAVLLQTAVQGQEVTAAAPETASGDVCVGENVLLNGSFEGDYQPYVMAAPGHPDCQTWDPARPNQYCERVKLPPGWHPWWRSSPRTESWMHIQPEYVPSLPHEQPPRVRSGQKSQHYFSFWSTHEGGVYQQVTAVPGGDYCFQAWGHAWSSYTSLPGYTSDPDNHGFLYQRVGIDPTGGADWQSPHVIWSAERMQYDEFGLFAVSATAQAETITVFLYSRTQLPAKHSDVYWDDALLALEKALAVQPAAIAVMTDVNAPATLTRTVSIAVTPALPWTAVLSASGPFPATLSAAAGSGSAAIELVMDTSGLAAGTYRADLTISAGEGVGGSPAVLPLTLYVAPQLKQAFLPLITR